MTGEATTKLTPEERNAIRKWLAGEAPKPPTFLRDGEVVTVPKEKRTR